MADVLSLGAAAIFQSDLMCLQNIVTLGVCPDDANPLSGYTLMQAAGISPKKLAAIADERYVQGTALAMDKKALAINQVRTDLLKALHTNNVVTNTAQITYETSVFHPSQSMGTYNGERGVTIHRNTAYRGKLRQTAIKAVKAYPLASGPGQIIISDGTGNDIFWDVDFVANQVNIFDEDNLAGFPYVFPAGNGPIRVTIDQTDIPFASAKITCLKGCGGGLPNPCGWAEGWNGTNPVKDEGYGLSLEFYCDCNYDQILCDQAKSFTGELIWLKWQINIFEEQYKTDRFNGFVLYSKEDIQKVYLPDLENKYNSLWNAWMQGLLGTLKAYRDECLKCQGIRWVVNL